LLRSDEVFTQEPLQLVWPLGQDPVKHTPAEQDCPLGQAVPHAPQLLLSVVVVTHAPPQVVWPLAQDSGGGVTVELKVRVQLAVIAPVTYTFPFHDPAGHVPPTEIGNVDPAEGVTVKLAVAP
jgi:hypothetical protein